MLTACICDLWDDERHTPTVINTSSNSESTLCSKFLMVRQKQQLDIIQPHCFAPFCVVPVGFVIEKGSRSLKMDDEALSGHHFNISRSKMGSSISSSLYPIARQNFGYIPVTKFEPRVKAGAEEKTAVAPKTWRWTSNIFVGLQLKRFNSATATRRETSFGTESAQKITQQCLASWVLKCTYELWLIQKRSKAVLGACRAA